MHPTARTAIKRGGPSAPLKALWKEGLIQEPVLDFGSGRGEDVRWLRGRGLQVDAFDPHHGPTALPRKKYQTVLATYVHCVLDPPEQRQATQDILSLLKPGGAGYVSTRTDTCPHPPGGVQTCVRLKNPVELSGSGFRTYRLAPRGRGQRAKQIGSKKWVHSSALTELPPSVRKRVKAIGGSPEIIRFDPTDSSIMLGWSSNFGTTPTPWLDRSELHRPGRPPLKRSYTGDSRPVYHRTELMLPEDHPSRRHLARQTEKMESQGLLGRPDIGTVRSSRRAQANRSLQARATELRKEAEAIWRKVGPEARHPDYRTKKKRSAGRCYQTGLWLRDKFPGQTVKLIQGAEGSCKKHFWVRVGGTDVDITGDQYGHPKVQVGSLPYKGKVRSWPKSRAPSGHPGAMMRAQANAKPAPLAPLVRTHVAAFLILRWLAGRP